MRGFERIFQARRGDERGEGHGHPRADGHRGGSGEVHRMRGGGRVFRHGGLRFVLLHLKAGVAYEAVLKWRRGDMAGMAFEATHELATCEIARLAGVAASEWSWTPLFLDVDLDGWAALLISNGHELDMMDADIIEQSERMKAQKVVLANKCQLAV